MYYFCRQYCFDVGQRVSDASLPGRAAQSSIIICMFERGKRVPLTFPMLGWSGDMPHDFWGRGNVVIMVFVNLEYIKV